MLYVNDEKNRQERAQAKRELYSFERIFAAKREKQLELPYRASRQSMTIRNFKHQI